MGQVNPLHFHMLRPELIPDVDVPMTVILVEFFINLLAQFLTMNAVSGKFLFLMRRDTL